MTETGKHLAHRNSRRRDMRKALKNKRKINTAIQDSAKLLSVSERPITGGDNESQYEDAVADNGGEDEEVVRADEDQQGEQPKAWEESVDDAIMMFEDHPATIDWPTAHANAISKSLRFTLNDTHYDYERSLQLYKSFNAMAGHAFAPFKHGFTNTLGVPKMNGDNGSCRPPAGQVNFTHLRSGRCVSRTPHSLLLNTSTASENCWV